MALGSSAPEILLSVIETVSTLGSTPGELGPSTIVGSAAFNLLVISAVSIMAVSPDIEQQDPDPEVPKGVKKINDLGVFGITTVSSIFAYVWLYLVLKVISPNYVELWEAWLTFAFFIILIVAAYFADKANEAKIKKKQEKEKKDKIMSGKAETEDEDPHSIPPFGAVEFYHALIAEKKGQSDNHPKEVSKREQMKHFLKVHFETDQID